jgi:hypothetical protein
MKFYYEDNKEATWGTDKWSMPVKHIIEVLEKQGEQKDILEDATLDNNEDGLIAETIRYKNEKKPAEWSEEDNKIIEEIINDIECAKAINYHTPIEGYEFRKNWLKSLKPKNRWKPSEEMLEALFKKLLNDSLEHLEKRNKNEMDCLTVLQTNMKNIESKYNYINIIN